MTLESKGNNLVDCAAKQAAQNKYQVIPVLIPIKSLTPVYSDQEIHIARNEDIKKMHRTGLLNMRGKSLYPKITPDI